MKRSIILTVLTIGYVIALIAGFLMPAESLGKVYGILGVGKDLVLHMGAFFVLVLLLRFKLASKLYNVKRPLLFAVIFSVIVAVVLELAQMIAASRHPMFIDVGLHMAGIAGYAVIDLGARYFSN